MRIDDTPRVSLTWEQFRQALANFGFEFSESKNAQMYVEPTSQTVLLFPLREATAPVELHHLLMARENTTAKGVTDKATFDTALYQHASLLSKQLVT